MRYGTPLLSPAQPQLGVKGHALPSCSSKTYAAIIFLIQYLFVRCGWRVRPEAGRLQGNQPVQPCSRRDSRLFQRAYDCCVFGSRYLDRDAGQVGDRFDSRGVL